MWRNERGGALRGALSALFAERGVAMSSTGVGSILGIHFQTTPIRTPADVVGASRSAALLHLEMMSARLLLRPARYLALPVVLEQADLDRFDRGDGRRDRHAGRRPARLIRQHCSWTRPKRFRKITSDTGRRVSRPYRPSG